MRRRVAWIATIAVALVIGAATAVVVTGQDDDDQWPGRGMMTSERSGDPGVGDDQRQRGSRGPGAMFLGVMPGMPGARTLTEYAFLAEMVAHHDEAVAMAKQLRRSDRPQMRSFGTSIVATQSVQVDQMRNWLRQWYPDRTGRVDYQPMMRDLSGLVGDRLDQVFLQDMVGHHMAAVMMSQRLLMSGAVQHVRVASLARSIRDEQHAEIVQMQQWLRAWFGVSWHHGMRGSGRGGMAGMGDWTMH